MASRDWPLPPSWLGSVPVEFLAKWEAYGQQLGTLNPAVLGVSALLVALSGEAVGEG